NPYRAQALQLKDSLVYASPADAAGVLRQRAHRRVEPPTFAVLSARQGDTDTNGRCRQPRHGVQGSHEVQAVPDAHSGTPKTEPDDDDTREGAGEPAVAHATNHETLHCRSPSRGCGVRIGHPA